MKDLIDRLSKLDGPDWDCDAKIWMHLIEKPKSLDKIDRDMIGRYPFYTSSIDASVALVGRVLPGWKWGLHPCGGLTRAYVGEISPLRPTPIFAVHALPAIALCIAILRAKEAGHD